MKLFSGKKLMITGGTGSFGEVVLKRFIDTEIEEIRIFSRDELKQEDMRHRYSNPKLKFYLGDVRDYQSVENAVNNVDYIFHAAALKQVPSCEFYPLEAIKTNILGTENVLEAAVKNNVKKVICLSTDKAVYPVNAMGLSKAMMEKVMVAKTRNLDKSQTVICGTRYGNVLGSRGSVVPLFLEQIQKGKPITITDPEMTRFIMTIESAVDLVLYAFRHGKNGDIFVQKAPAVTILILAEAILSLVNRQNHPIKIIGTRHGEKQFETLLNREEMAFAENLGEYYRIRTDTRDLNYSQYTHEGSRGLERVDDYNSNNTRQLSLTEIAHILKQMPVFCES